MIDIPVNPEAIEWAANRSKIRNDLENKFPKLNKWISGEKKPSLKQLENFAKSAYVPIGYFFLKELPKEKLPVDDLRTHGSEGVRDPSPNLLDTIYLCQRRQAWYHDYAKGVGERKRIFVGSATITSSVETIAAEIAEVINFRIQDRREVVNYNKALKEFINKVEDSGILVMISGIVGNNPHRSLELAEFRGFALVDEFAPLVFINSRDSKAGQIFTLAHEIAHLWLGKSALSDVGLPTQPRQAIEKWCNAVAAELLVPLGELIITIRDLANPVDQIDTLARNFKVSKLVILRRLWDAGVINKSQFQEIYDRMIGELSRFVRTGESGGNFYATLLYRLGYRFTRAVINSTFDGQTLFRDAFRMLGVRNEEVLKTIGDAIEAAS